MRIRDEFQNEFIIREEIGSGGEGEVWALEGGRGAAKFLLAANATREELQAKLRRIMRTDLRGIPIAAPHGLIDGPLGYIMELLEDMVPLTTLYNQPRGADTATWYRDTGGLRRRLTVLAKLADALHRLHAKALAYCDISPGNVLISRLQERDNVWLIDPDNISAESDHSTVALFTPAFGAPEVVRSEKPNDTLSDVFSLALVVYRVLIGNHPFYGDMVHLNKAHEPAAYSGELPWINHPTDERNRSTKGMPIDWTLTPALFRLASQAFEDGLVKPESRPSAANWRDELLRAADFTYSCPTCMNTVYAFHDKCPWCTTAKPPLLFAELLAHVPVPAYEPDQPSGLTPRNHVIVLTPSNPVRLDARRALAVLEPGPGKPPAEPDAPVAELIWHGGNDLSVRRKGHLPVVLIDKDSTRWFDLHQEQIHPLPSDQTGFWDIRFGAANHLHHVLSISTIPRRAR
jgi:DNA-binding helix-hairpin-helix protein with protein kinase domain